MKLYYIYGLVDPKTKEVKYVGLTTNPRNRFDQHYYNHQTQSRKKYEWIDSLKKENLRIEMTILEEVETSDRNVALNLEQKWMNIHKNTLLEYRHPQVLENSKKGLFTSLMIKKDLKNKLEDLAMRQSRKMSYPQVIDMLIDYYYENEDKIKNALFSTDDFNPYHNLNEQYRKKKENENN